MLTSWFNIAATWWFSIYDCWTGRRFNIQLTVGHTTNNRPNFGPLTASRLKWIAELAVQFSSVWSRQCEWASNERIRYDNAIILETTFLWNMLAGGDDRSQSSKQRYLVMRRRKQNRSSFRADATCILIDILGFAELCTNQINRAKSRLFDKARKPIQLIGW